MNRISPALVLALALALAPASLAQVAGGPVPPAVAGSRRVHDHPVDVVAILGTMEPLIHPCVQATTGPGVFTHCFDWHSSVHAHWAAYRIARVDPARNSIAEDSYGALTPAKLAYEATHVPAGQMPYGRAWFLRLAIEFERWALEYAKPDPQRLRPMADKLALELFAHYVGVTPTPTTPEYSNASWALTQLHAYAVHVGASADAAAVQTMVQQHFLAPYPQLTWAADLNDTGFFSRFGNWAYLLTQTVDDPTLHGFHVAHPFAPADLAVNAISTNHSYGLSWSRAWALKALAHRTPSLVLKKTYLDAWREHVHVGMLRHAALVGSFPLYDHWVPQFVVYAVTEGYP